MKKVLYIRDIFNSVKFTKSDKKESQSMFVSLLYLN